MNESEWLACKDPSYMVGRPGLSNRKLRLFAVACCRRVSDLLCDMRSQKAVDVAEQVAEGSETEEALSIAGDAAAANFEEMERADPSQDTEHKYAYRLPATYAAEAASRCTYWEAWEAAVYASYSVAATLTLRDKNSAEESLLADELQIHADLLRDIFGNPFRPVTFDASWRTATSVALATQMYASRDFSAAPILADALEEAGCDNSAILQHHRGENKHVRGCWVVDAVLGKE